MQGSEPFSLFFSQDYPQMLDPRQLLAELDEEPTVEATAARLREAWLSRLSDSAGSAPFGEPVGKEIPQLPNLQDLAFITSGYKHIQTKLVQLCSGHQTPLDSPVTRQLWTCDFDFSILNGEGYRWVSVPGFHHVPSESKANTVLCLATGKTFYLANRRTQL